MHCSPQLLSAFTELSSEFPAYCFAFSAKALETHSIIPIQHQTAERKRLQPVNGAGLTVNYCIIIIIQNTIFKWKVCTEQHESTHHLSISVEITLVHMIIIQPDTRAAKPNFKTTIVLLSRCCGAVRCGATAQQWAHTNSIKDAARINKLIICDKLWPAWAVFSHRKETPVQFKPPRMLFNVFLTADCTQLTSHTHKHTYVRRNTPTPTQRIHCNQSVLTIIFLRIEA